MAAADGRPSDGGGGRVADGSTGEVVAAAPWGRSAWEGQQGAPQSHGTVCSLSGTAPEPSSRSAGE